jgi:hypothetical protein
VVKFRTNVRAGWAALRFAVQGVGPRTNSPHGIRLVREAFAGPPLEKLSLYEPNGRVATLNGTFVVPGIA